MVHARWLLTLLSLMLACGGRQTAVTDPDDPLVTGESPKDLSDVLKSLPERDLDTVREAQLYRLAMAACMYGYPAVVFYGGMYEATVVGKAGKRVAFNEIVHADKLADPTDTSIPTPNNDTLYSSALLDLRAEPVVVSVPAVRDRYYSLQLMDAYSSTFGTIGSRISDQAGSYLIVGPGWRGDRPKQLQMIESPTPMAWLLGRTLINGADDLPAVQAIQRQYLVQPLSTYAKRPSPPAPPALVPLPASDSTDLIDYYRAVGLALALDPPLERDHRLAGRLHKLGFAKDWRFDPTKLSERQRTILRWAAEDSRKLVTGLTEMKGDTVNGWSKNIKGIGEFGTHYVLRAAVAVKGLGATILAEAAYPVANVDGRDRPLDGSHAYVLRFPAGSLPPAKAFWSVTMYDFDSKLLVDNELDRYSIGDRTPGLVKDADGSLTIRIQHTRPTADANWLPAPARRFYLVLRLYIPGPAFVSGDYKIPGVERVEP